MQLLKGRTRPGKAESIAVSVVSSSSRTIADCHERATRPSITAIGDPLIRIHVPGIDTEWNDPIRRSRHLLISEIFTSGSLIIQLRLDLGENDETGEFAK